MEDDIYFHKKINDYQNTIWQLKSKYDIVYLGANQPTWKNVKHKKGHYIVTKDNVIYGTYCMLLNNKAIKYIKKYIGKFMDPFPPDQMSIDTLIYKKLVCTNILKACCIYPNIVLPEVRESDNIGARSFRKMAEPRKWNTSLYKGINVFNRRYPYKFVFIIPSFNNLDWYRTNIFSVISQTYYNWHIIYIDDNSTDRTL